MLFWFYLRTSDAFIDKIIVIVIVIVSMLSSQRSASLVGCMRSKVITSVVNINMAFSCVLVAPQML